MHAKGTETMFLKECLEAEGLDVVVMDPGILCQSFCPGFASEIMRTVGRFQG